MNLSNLFIYIGPPIAGGIIGYFTNEIAIKMLFRPYRTIYIGQRRLPFTPGLIPRNQERLAKRISDTIMGSLLTPEELQNLARRLLQTERMEGVINWLLRMAMDQIKSDTEAKTAQILAGILHDFFGQSLPRMLKVLAKDETFLQEQLDQIFDQVLLEIQLNRAQARQLANWLLDVVLPPDVIRQVLVDFLTDRNIHTIDEDFREQSSGTYWVVANLIGLRSTLTRLRTFCLDEKEKSNDRIRDLIVALELRDRIEEWFQTLSLQNLPLSTVKQLRKTMGDSVRNYLQTSGTDLLLGLSNSIDWQKLSSLILNRLQKSAVVSKSLGLVSHELALILERYLERDLENLVAKAIPILNIDQVIINRVKATSPEDLENAINGIVKSELQAIVNLGGILGLVVGCMQTIILLLQS